jgi:hypothetical protein
MIPDLKDLSILDLIGLLNLPQYATDPFHTLKSEISPNTHFHEPDSIVLDPRKRLLQSCAAESAAREDGTSDHLHIHFNSILTVPHPKPLTGPYVTAQGLSMFDTAPPACLDSNSSKVASSITLPTSLEYEHYAQQRRLKYASSTEVTPKPNGTGEVLEDLYILAAWPRLRDATLPDPTVGDLESDPAEIASWYGVKGMSVYTAFIDRDSLRCRVCGDQSYDMTRAILHQRLQRHFQAQEDTSAHGTYRAYRQQA